MFLRTNFVFWLASVIGLERRAFSLVETGNSVEAVRILFSDEYHFEIGRIMEPIRRFQLRVDSETGAALESTRKTMQVSIAVIAFSLILCCLAGLYRQVKPDEDESATLLSN